MKKTAWVGFAAVLCVSSVVHAEGTHLAAPNGQLGAGIVFSPEQRGRAHAELGFFHATEGSARLNSFVWLVGLAYKVTPHVELEALLPIGILESGGSSSEVALGTGNLHFGVSYLHGERGFRMKLGAAVEYGPWTQDYELESTLAVALGHALGGGQDFGLWIPELLSVVVPGRFEFGDTVVASADLALGAHISTGNADLFANGTDVEISFQVAPGVGVYVSDRALLGLRAPVALIPTNVDNDGTLLALEPYFRYDLAAGFLNARFSMNLDEPYGFSFDEGRFWGLHVGGGATF